MNWETIFTTQRIGQQKESAGPRSGFQKDFDRIIFSSAFRRLQNKTQVFPLPGSTFVHNRLTHSLEVASVGRSLGSMVGEKLSKEIADKSSDSYEFYRYELANVIAAGCLAHDIGNPAFGHSGEKAISAYFINNANSLIDEKQLQSFFSEREWADISNFEGNANAIRILTHVFKGRLTAGLGLTYTTIASILKYPCEATGIDKRFKHRKKFGFFLSEAHAVHAIAEKLGMHREEGETVMYKRHPFVYLVEAADDICYSIIDMEDAHRLGILSHDLVRTSFFHVIDCLNDEQDFKKRTEEIYDRIDDMNEKISFLRARAINLLTIKAAEVFWENRQSILEGTFNDTLIDNIENRYGALKEVMKISNEKIYNHDTVLEIEIAGYNVMSELLGLFVPALLKKKPDHKDEKVLKLFPVQFREFEDTNSPYEKVLSAFDLISGMTDLYATEMYRKLKGVDIPQHR
ncbi:dGTP triphosphohydrolase [Segetibacter sp.]|jgi:dGTPase|uniref:dGTP triphosphohydrolase n=1 Tax=Segetibacter sp. TaxID=2231182 RepID=UPI0026343209|nr:dNTP triphosphohydrolase [Segetibacter sp.]MCW3080850.1 deoxyguanosinetriphosphate triphosphohydrolase [Segetibacter sp.]